MVTGPNLRRERMEAFQINEERWNKIKDLPLGNGLGTLDKELCIMQAVDYVTSGGLTDSPACSCPILSRYAIRINDAFNAEHRKSLKPLIPLLVGTAIDDAAVKIRRKQFLMFRNVTATYPIILDLIKLPELAEKLRTFQNTAESMKEAAEWLKENVAAIKKAANADANAYANAYADAYANAYADAFREKLAVVAVETLRLACEIKE